jgi:mRNA interferase RelE/StbE
VKSVYRKKFLKELSLIPSLQRKEIEKFVFEEILTFNSITERGKIKIKGYTNFYKIRFGDYRVGIKLEDNIIIFERVLHRKDIYRYFP